MLGIGKITLGQCLAAAALLAMSGCASAQETSSAAPAPAEAAPDCSSAAHHQFDFWLGEWQVSPSRAPDRVIARSTIRSSADGCVIDETWRPLRGGEGRSLSGYNARDGRWHQYYIDSSGAQTHSTGAFSNGAMVLDYTTPAGGQGRMSLQALDVDTVRQWGEEFNTEQNAWTPSFDLTYRRAAAEE